VNASDDATVVLAELARLHALQRAAFARERYPSAAIRRDRLARLLALVRDHEREFVAAIDADFGGRSSHETRLGEAMIVETTIRHAMRALPRWMRARRVRTPLSLAPGRGFVLPQPLGVVGVISPWNYPLQLALVPVAGAIAAGNRAMLKPSELVPRTSALLAEHVGRRFDASELAVLTGNATLGAAFAATRFDHLFFTGSTAVGRHVARAAAENLVPVTLELGGKSPALIAPDADLDRTAPRLVAGKLFNAGQTCIAPDYAVVPVALRDALVERIKASVARFYPTLGPNPDYSAIVNERHAERLRYLIEDARERGASIVAIDPAGDAASASARKFAPTLILGATDDMAVMREEIFGPLLPIETYASLDEAVARLAARPRPLAFYYFGEAAATRDRVLRETIAGGVTVNDTLYHFAHEALPFGGVGESGSGAYHGERSFETFSHMKGVFVQSRRSPAYLLWPPYGRAFEGLLALLRRL